MKRKVIKIIIVLIILVLLVGLYLYTENNTLEISRYSINSKKISMDFDGYKIAQISDFHNTSSNKLKDSIIASLKKEKPDMIVITGDFIDSYMTNIDISIDFIKNINTIAPIYYVAGNHESRIGSDYLKLKKQLVDNKVIILEDEVRQVVINNSVINLIGLNDPTLKHKSDLEDKEIVGSVIDDLEYDKNVYTVVLSHRPELFDLYVSNNFDLVLSGHSHGGQIRVPFIGGLFAPNQWWFPKYDGGLYEKKNTKMIVSRGIGNSLFPFRINNNPDLVYITLKYN